MNDLWLIVVFWGGMLLIPFLIDGIATLSHFFLLLSVSRDRPEVQIPVDGYPTVSIIIPAYNEEASIEHCLLGIRAQTYPQEKIEVFIVDDGSTDNTVDVVLKHIGNLGVNQRYLRTNSFTVPVRSFGGVMTLVRTERSSESGKAHAFNAGLARASGEFIVAVDADVVLAPDAVGNTVQAFLADDSLLAATGHLIVDETLVVEHDANGTILLDDVGIPVTRHLSPSENILTACQFIEYVSSFHLGRRSESFVDGMFTIAGACAAFRATVFDIGRKFSRRTVSEDADLTLSMHRLSDFRIGYLPGMRAHLAPSLRWSHLYSQRIRWQRGALEVSSIHLPGHKGSESKWLLWNILLPLRLQINHTLVFPRIIWLLVLLMLPIFGYSWELIGRIVYLIYLLYLFIFTSRLLVGYLFSSVTEKIFIRKYLRYLPLYPIYNTLLLWVYLSAGIQTLTENAKWNTEIPLLSRFEVPKT